MMTAGPRVPEELLLWRISSRILSISSRKCQSEEKGTVVIEIGKIKMLIMWSHSTCNKTFYYIFSCKISGFIY